MKLIFAFQIFFWCLSSILPLVCSDTNPQDAAALRSLLSQWQNAPPSWGQSSDPCNTPWDGVSCNNSRITSIILSTMGLQGTLGSDLGQLTELQTLDFSYNTNLGGPLTRNIGNLNQLTTLRLLGCSFTGNIPSELGNLTQLTFLALNSNKFSGTIPASLGQLSNLYWLDLADNQLTGPIPISSATSPGLDQLVNTRHFHFNKNQLSGPIPEQLFSSQMNLLNILFDGNQFTGGIPSSVALIQSLEALRLDKNSLSSAVPSNINNLTGLYELNLANNNLVGPLPNLTGMTSLNYVDMSNNSFDTSEAPVWFSTLKSLNALVIESGSLVGNVPNTLFSLPQLQQVILNDNHFNDTLDLSNAGPDLQLVNFQNNSITKLTSSSSSSIDIMLAENPVCNNNANANYCLLQQELQAPYTTSLAKCGSFSCPGDQNLNPQSCACAYPYQGVMVFRAPYFRDISNSSIFQQLETSLWTNLSLTPGAVFIFNVYFNIDSYLQLNLALFPSSGTYFNRSEILRLGSLLSSQKYQAPQIFGTYYFNATAYTFEGAGGNTAMSKGAIAGISVGCAALVVVLVAAVLYALRQKRKAKTATQLNMPFASWGQGDKDVGSAPQLKGARWFSFNELKKCTKNFAETNELGVGGYGKVYKGKLSDGKVIAIKRSQEGSQQGGLEFKTEIELLSRVHHKNLVELVGFCFEEGEQILVYEFIPNGTLKENLIGKGGRVLDWKRRLMIALGSARGLAYLHELVNPSIVHRDIKTANILLDENLNAKVADFGLSKLIDSEKTHVSTQVKGTLGYLDPEYYMTQQLTEKSDVYSFGVVMLELITSRPPIEQGKYIVREVKLAIDERDDYYGLEKLIDPVIRDSSNVVGFRRFVELALRCVDESASSRPSMNQVSKKIEALMQDAGMGTVSDSMPSTEINSSVQGALYSSNSSEVWTTNESIPQYPSYNTISSTDESASIFQHTPGK